jgi:hypothetical protein
MNDDVRTGANQRRIVSGSVQAATMGFEKLSEATDVEFCKPRHPSLRAGRDMEFDARLLLQTADDAGEIAGLRISARAKQADA